MVGIVKVDTLQNNAGTSSVDMDYVVNGSAKATLTIDIQTGSTNTVRASFNYSSNTDNGGGDFNISFTNSFSDIYYRTVGSSAPGSSTGNPYNLCPNRERTSGTYVAPTTGGQRLNTEAGNTARDVVGAYISQFGDLA